jgi:hypothetical protein
VTFSAAQVISWYLKIPFFVSITFSIQTQYPKENTCIKQELNGMFYAKKIIFPSLFYLKKFSGPFFQKSYHVPNGVNVDEIESIIVPEHFTLPGNKKKQKIIIYWPQCSIKKFRFSHHCIEIF